MIKKRKLWLLPVLAAILILCFACSGTETDPQADNTPQTSASEEPIPGSELISIVTPEPDLHREELDAILKRTTMLNGVTINGIDVGGLTLDEARAKVLPTLESQKKNLSVNVTLGDIREVFSANTITTTDTLEDALSKAFALVREDTGFDAVSAEVETIKTNGMDFPVTVAFEETALRTAVNAFAEAHETQPQNATVGYNKENNEIDFIAEINGKTIDRDALVASLLAAKNGDTIEANAVEKEAEVKLADIQSKYILRSTMTTKYSSSNKNRKENIRHGAMDLLTGTVVHPGEVFSMNDCLGVRKNDGHWKIATAYQQGAHVKEYGGGVCQISSTLYNAAVMADMEIVFRQNHSMPVDYVERGRDATINSIGNIIDFKFKNSSKSDIIIIANANGKTLTIEIWGIAISEDSNGAYDEIRIPTPKKIRTINPTGSVEYQVDNTKPVGYKEQIVKDQKGSVWESYKEYYLNGVLVKSELLATSTYKAYSAVYIVGPDATPAPETTPTATSAPGTTPPAATEPTTPTAAADTPTPTAPPADTPKPTEQPSDTPAPTEAPTEKPTEAPTEKPTEAPTAPPTDPPTAPPTDPPTAPPTDPPTAPPSDPTTPPNDGEG